MAASNVLWFSSETRGAFIETRGFVGHSDLFNEYHHGISFFYSKIHVINGIFLSVVFHCIS